MRSRIAALAAGTVAFASAAVPGGAGALPQHNSGATQHDSGATQHDSGATIRVAPNSVQAGDDVLIYGRLTGARRSHRLIRLYHRIDPKPSFSLIQTTRTDSAGRYEFVHLRDIVNTNRSWYVRGPDGRRSRTVSEQVGALVTMAPSAPAGVTRHPIVFSGHVTANHAGEHVLLQVQHGSSDRWTTVASGPIGPDSNYAIPCAWRTPGDRFIRVRFGGDERNTAGFSNPLPVIIQQDQAPGFTIATNDPIVSNNAPAKVSGILDQIAAATPIPGVTVQLLHKRPGRHPYKELQSTTTDAAGGYSFNVRTTTNELYRVQTAALPMRSTAVLFQGVQDAVNVTARSSSTAVGGRINFRGDVSPDKTGHVIYLQKLGNDHNWHNVQARLVRRHSTFRFAWTFGAAGQKVFRARITGDPANLGGASSPVTIAVSQPPLSSLPAH
jgi:hypothetical protein